MKIEQKIPEGWSVKKLKDLSTKGIFNGIFNDPKKVGRGVPLINVVDLYQDNINFSNLSLLDVTEDELVKYEAEEGDLLFTRSSLKLEGIAHCNLVKKYSGRVVYDCHLMRVRTNQALAVPYYLYTFCNTKMAKQNFMSNAKTTTMTTIDQKGLGDVLILLPPLPEQEKIAGILSCWDDEIEKLSSLIEKKKIQKKALMQQLLTGNHRLKGFSTPWHEVKLKDVLYEHKETSKGDETICSVSVHKGIISQIEHLGRSLAASNTSNYNLVHYGDVVYTKSPTGEFPYGIFKQSQQRKSVIVSPLYGVFTPKTYYLGYILDVFFSYAINLNNYLKPIIQKGAKNTINITNETFLSKAIFLPEETTEIQKLAEIFIKADEEIELLNKKLEAFKQEKKALMQQLLTGKIRVKVN